MIGNVIIVIVLFIIAYFSFSNSGEVDTFRPEPSTDEIAVSENALMDTALDVPNVSSTYIPANSFFGSFNSFLGNGDIQMETSLPDFNWVDEYDSLIYEHATTYNIDPRLVKGVMWQESRFIYDVISYIFDRSTLKPRKEFTRSQVKDVILTSSDGGMSYLINNNIDCSCGLMQVRTGTALTYLKMITPKSLFTPSIAIQVGVMHIAGLRKAGVVLPDGIDAYNMGVGNYKRGNRNLSYRDIVIKKMREFQNDFPS